MDITKMVGTYAQTSDGKSQPCYCYRGGYCDFHDGPCYYPPIPEPYDAMKCAAQHNEGPYATIAGQFPND